MIEFTVTGIRYQMGEHLSYEERDAKATKFVASLEIGQPVVLKFEPDNPGSPNKAIAVYINYEHIGYTPMNNAIWFILCSIGAILARVRWCARITM